MTRAERLAQQEARAKAQLAAQRQRLARVKDEHKHAVQKERGQRQKLVGQLAEDAGLLVLSDTDLSMLFRLFALLLADPNPVGLLASLLQESGVGAVAPPPPASLES